MLLIPSCTQNHAVTYTNWYNFEHHNGTNLSIIHPTVSVAQVPSNRSLLFFSAAQLHIGIPISSLILIFIKCEMCQVFAQRVTFVESAFGYNLLHKRVNSCAVGI